MLLIDAGQVLFGCFFSPDFLSSFGSNEEVNPIAKANTNYASFTPPQAGKLGLVDERVRTTSNSMFISCVDPIGIPQKLFFDHSCSMVIPVMRDKTCRQVVLGTNLYS